MSMRPLTRRRAGEAAFTLVELAVVLVCLVLLAVLLLPILNRKDESHRRVSCQSNLNQLIMACHLYSDVAGNGSRFPDDQRSAMGSLGMLYDSKLISDPRIFACPSRLDISAKVFQQAKADGNIQPLLRGSGSYGYDRRHDATQGLPGIVGDFSGSSAGDSAQSNSTNHGTKDGHGVGQNVVFGHGAVEWWDTPGWPKNAGIQSQGVTDQIFRDDTAGGIPVENETWLRTD